MANKYVFIIWLKNIQVSILLLINEMQIKTSVKYYFIPTHLEKLMTTKH